MHVPRAVTKLSEDSQLPPAERLGLSHPVGVAEQQGQVVEADGHAGMIRAQALFNNSQRPAEKRLGLRVLALGPVKLRQVVEGIGHIGMIRAQDFFPDRHRPIVKGLCLRGDTSRGSVAQIYAK